MTGNILQTYYWTTDQPHSTNQVTLEDYLHHHLDNEWVVVWFCGTSAEIVNGCGARLEVHASGNGDFFNHKVSFVEV